MKILLSAHRCGTDKFPELTLEAANYSLGLGADSVEMDIRFTKDKVPVISHDKDGAKLFGSSQNVCDLTLEEFLKLRFIDAPQYRPHTLEEVLSSKAAPILFHIKEGGNYLKTILDYISRYQYEDKVFMGVQTVADVKQVKEYNPQIKVLAFTQDDNRDQDFLDAGADIIRLWEDWVSQERVDGIKAQGRQVWIMAGSPIKRTVGYAKEETVLSWQDMGVNGIIINEIAKTRKLMDRMRG